MLNKPKLVSLKKEYIVKEITETTVKLILPKPVKVDIEIDCESQQEFTSPPPSNNHHKKVLTAVDP